MQFGKISIHAPPRGATTPVHAEVADVCDFNSRPSARGDAPFQWRPSSPAAFQFTPLREGRRWPPDRGRNPPPISIHAPPRGATANAAVVAALDVFQFTPLREGRPLFSISCGLSEKFQFTPLREGRLDCLRRRGKPQHFNSRPSARGDGNIVFLEGTDRISIHAPPRGATCRRHRVRGRGHFNSRPSARGDQKIKRITILQHHFNSRPSARGDLLRSCTYHLQSNFNSRPSARGDPLCLSENTTMDNFNSRPSARGDLCV